MMSNQKADNGRKKLDSQKTSTPKKVLGNRQPDESTVVLTKDNDLIDEEAALDLDDSCFDASDFQAIDELILTQTALLTRKSVTIDSPGSSQKNHKRQRVGSAHKIETQENLEVSRLSEISQPLTSNLQSVLLSNAQKPTALKPCSRMLQFQPAERIQETSCNTSMQDSSLGEELYFGLPLKVKQLIEDFKDIKELYKWQQECLNLDAIKIKKNLIYSLPTSGGKTLVAEILILREILCHKKNAIFVLPYVSIVQEKVRSLSPFALALGFLVEEYAGGKGQYPPRQRRWKQVVYVATIEKALGLVNSLIEGQRLHELGLAVVDELHMVGEPGRGATLETLLTRLMFAQAEVQVIGMSATIGNLKELSQFLNADTYSQDFRPVELREHVKIGQILYEVPNKPNIGAEEPLVPARKLPPVSAKSSDPDQVGVLVSEVVPNCSCLVFCPTKVNCENVAKLVCSTLPKSVIQHKNDEKRALYHALIVEGGGSVCPTLKRTLPYGVAYHHSGLTMSERNLLEEGYRAGTLCCLCCTSTLAAGVNLPAKRVILRSPKVGIELLSLSQYKQMVGRAGRAGMDTEGESILICQPEELPQVQTLLGTAMNECVSKLAQPLYYDEGEEEQPTALEGLILSSVCLGQTHNDEEVEKLVNCSLLATQAKRLDIDIKAEVHRVVTKLTSKQVFYFKPDCDMPQLAVSALGRAAMRAHLSVSRAEALQADLKQAQGGLNLLTPLHLLYVVTPPDLVNSTRFSPLAFATAFKALPVADQKTVLLVGITEGMVATMMAGAVPRSASMSLLKRVNVALLLRAAWEGASVWDVAHQFELPRGDVQSLMSAAAAFASNVQNFCQELPESFWCFSALLGRMAERLAHCCAAELLPLMELPAVKKGRARQLFDAGYRTLNDVAGADPQVLSTSIRHLPLRVARHIISTAHMLLLERAESLREDAEGLLEGVLHSNVVLSTSHQSSPSTPGRPASASQMPVPHASWASPKLHSPRTNSLNTSV
ncbi:hypothetical protein B566_EDAN008243 [Ephemera danica]|nr:hypothetical protein B566_EDAN008243 [Ephemera danica]